MFRTVWHRLFVVRLVDRAILRQLKRSGVKIGWSIGPTLYGRYYEILDAPYPVLKAISHDLLATFRQEAVIFKSYDTGEFERIRVDA